MRIRPVHTVHIIQCALNLDCARPHLIRIEPNQIESRLSTSIGGFNAYCCEFVLVRSGPEATASS